MKYKVHTRRSGLIKLLKTFGIDIDALDHEEKDSGNISSGSEKFLTADGEIIELPKGVAGKVAKKCSSSNKDIIEWSNRIKS